MLGLVVIGKNHFPLLCLKLGFSCEKKETLIQINRLLWLQHLSQLVTAWKYLYYAKLVFSVFYWFFFAKGHVPFFSFFFNPLAISRRACLFDLIWFDILRNDNNFALFLGRFLINWTHVRFILRPSIRVFVLVICTIHIFTVKCFKQPQSVRIFTAVFFVTITIIRFTIFLYKWSFMCRGTQSDFGIEKLGPYT